MFIPRKMVEEKLKQILADDIGLGDVTAAAVISPNLSVKAEVIAKESGIVAGIEEAKILAEYLGLTVNVKVVDGEKIKNQTSFVADFGGCPNYSFS